MQLKPLAALLKAPLIAYSLPSGPDGVAYLSELPPGLHAAAMSALFGARLRSVPLFAGCERPFLDRLAGRLRLSLVMGGDILYDIGAVGHDM